MRTPLLVLLSCLTLHAQSVKLAWDPNAEIVAGYRVLWGATNRVYTRTNSVQGQMNNTAIVTNLFSGRNVFAVLAYADDGTESDLSNEVAWTNKPAPPKNFKASAVLQASQNVTGPWTNLAILPLPMTNQLFVRTRLFMEEVK